MNSLIPFLSEWVPSAIAVKAIAKKRPELSKFIDAASTYGYGANAIVDFLREQLPGFGTEDTSQLAARKAQGVARPDEESALQEMRQRQSNMSIGKKAIGAVAGLATGGMGLPITETIASMIPGDNSEKSETSVHEAGEPTQVEGQEKESSGENPIQDESDELHDLITAFLKNGHQPVAAGALVKMLADSSTHKHLKKPISRLEKKHKTQFPDLVGSIYGGMQTAPIASPAPQQAPTQQIPQTSSEKLPPAGSPQLKELLKQQMIRYQQNLGRKNQ